MAKTANPIPPGFHTVTPYLTVRSATKAIEFYKKALGAEEICVIPGPEGRTMHAEIKIGDSIIMLSDECAEYGALGPESRGGATSSLFLYFTNVDTAFDRAVKAGCTVKMPLQDQFWGDRFGTVIDPFGHVWSMATHIEDVNPEDMKKRHEEAVKQMATARAK
jgi:PhnB protein